MQKSQKQRVRFDPFLNDSRLTEEERIVSEACCKRYWSCDVKTPLALRIDS